MSSVAAQTTAASEDRTVAILSYLTLLGFIIAVVIHLRQKTELGAFHLRQALGFWITCLALGFIFIIPVLGWFLAIVGFPTIMVLYLIGFVYAFKGKMRPAPLVGGMYQRLLAGTFA